jgi:hypothetical protein
MTTEAHLKIVIAQFHFSCSNINLQEVMYLDKKGQSYAERCNAAYRVFNYYKIKLKLKPVNIYRFHLFLCVHLKQLEQFATSDAVYRLCHS